jgi:hypothetical protein
MLFRKRRMPKDWKNEDDIKAELRVLTDELRTLRHELRNMVSPKPKGTSRAFLHRHSWPTATPRLDDEMAKDDSEAPPPRKKKG